MSSFFHSVLLALALLGPAALTAQEKKPKATETTAHCVLVGTYQNGSLALSAKFDFVTYKARTPIYLGLKDANLSWDEKAPPRLDGGFADLHADADGSFYAIVDKAGTHKLTMDLIVPVTVGQERSFEFGLPRSTSTQVILNLPAGVKKIRWNDRDESGPGGRWEIRWLTGEKSLKVSWREPGVAVGPALLKADVDVKVHLDKNQTDIQAVFHLGLLQGQTKEWLLWLPTQTRLKSTLPADWVWIAPEGRPGPYVIRHTKEGGAESLIVAVETLIPRTPAQPKIALGPFLVQGATQSKGLIHVMGPVDGLQGLRPFFKPIGELYQQPSKVTDPKTAGFESLAHFYFSGNPLAKKGLPPTSILLEVELKPERSVIETSVQHDLKFRQEGSVRYWDLESRFLAKTPALLDAIDVQVPAFFLWHTQVASAFPPQLPLWLALYPFDVVVPEQLSDDGGPLPKLAGNRLSLRMKRTGTGEWEGRLQARYPAPPGRQRLRLELPRPAGGSDRGAKVAVQMPPDLELLIANRGLDEPVGDKQTLSFEQTPATLELAWRPYVPEMSVTSKVIVDVKKEQVWITQHFEIARPTKGPKSVLTLGRLGVDFPNQARNRKLLQGELGKNDDLAGKKTLWIKPVSDPAGSLDFAVKFGIALPTTGELVTTRLAIPLVWPQGVTWKEATVFIYTEPGMAPRIVREAGQGDVWLKRASVKDELSPENVVPSAVLVGAGRDLPLVVEVEKPVGAKIPPLLCDRTVVQVHVDDEGNQNYRVRIGIRKIAANHVDIELPVPWAQATLEVKDVGKITNFKIIDASRNLAQIPLDQVGSQGATLEIRYQIPAGTVEGRLFWQTTFKPPEFSKEVFLGKVRWLISLHEAKTPIVFGPVQVDFRWALKRGLLGPEPPRIDDLDGDWDLEEAPSLVFWRTQMEPQRVIHLGWQPWILLCSGTVLLLGLALMLLSDARLWFWGLMAALTAGLCAAAWSSPYVLAPFLWGSQAGLGVLLLIAGIHWLLQERYRRQLVFLPGFSRKTPGSTLSRPKKPREASTVDSPMQREG